MVEDEVVEDEVVEDEVVEDEVVEDEVVDATTTSLFSMGPCTSPLLTCSKPEGEVYSTYKSAR